jgi:hypothetical protein
MGVFRTAIRRGQKEKAEALQMASSSDMSEGRTAATSGYRTAIQKAAAAIGAVFLLVGILGFIPGVTSDFGQISGAGVASHAMLLGIFQVSVLHNLVHIAFGIAGLALARSMSMARTYLIGGGVIYLVLWLYGLIIDQNSGANFVPVNTADNWLHFALGAGMIAVGFVLGNRTTNTERGM